MFNVLIGAILAMAGVFLLLSLVIVGNKLWRDSARRWIRRRRRSVEPKLLQYLTGERPTVRDALGRRPRRRDKTVLEAILIDVAPGLHAQEKRRVPGAFEELGLTRRYLRRLGASAWWRRAEAAERLGLTGSPNAIAPLTRALADVSTEVRLRAARSLAELGGPTALKPLIQSLHEPSRWSTIRIAHILTSRGAAIVPDLIASWTEVTPGTQLAMLDILGQIGDNSACDFLKQRLEDSDADVRARAASALGDIGDPSAGDALTRALHDRAWQVRAMAAKSAGAIRHPTALPNLAMGLRDDVWWVRTNCAEALLQLGPEGLDALIRMLHDVDTYAAHQAVSVLEDAGVIDEQVDALAAINAETSGAARSFIEQLIAVGQTERLRELSETHALEPVRRQLIELLPEEAPAEEGVA